MHSMYHQAMRMHQLKLLCQAVDCDLNLSSTARSAHISQPSVSRHLQALEEELGVAVFVRTRRRLCGLTSTGQQVLELARRILRDLDAVEAIGRDAVGAQLGTITIAASHTYARYALPGVIRTFMALHPNVRLVLRQGDPLQILHWADSGEADLAICAETESCPRDLALFNCSRHGRVILMPRDHPLGRSRRPSLQQLAGERLITYDANFTLHRRIVATFEAAGLAPDIVLTATDVDVMKAYVRSGMGIAVMAALAYSRDDDRDLLAVDASHLFEPAAINVVLHRGRVPRPFVFDFIALFAPALRRETMQRVLAGGLI